MYLRNRWYGLRLKHHKTQDTALAECLDVSVLQEKILAPVFGIRDIRTDKRIEFVGGGRGTVELKRRVDEGRAAVGFSLFPTRVNDLLCIADAGEFMPPIHLV